MENYHLQCKTRLEIINHWLTYAGMQVNQSLNQSNQTPETWLDLVMFAADTMNDGTKLLTNRGVMGARDSPHSNATFGNQLLQRLDHLMSGCCLA